MKKPMNLLISLTALFAAFTLGFFLGRNANHTQIRLSTVSPVQTQPTETQAPTEEVPVESTSLPPETTTPETQAPTESGLININTATQPQLESLPGIGEVLAQRIIAYREENGPFTSISQLTLVSGIGEKKLAAILDLITV